MSDTSEWTAEDREEFERDLIEEKRQEILNDMKFEEAMSDPDFAYPYIINELSDSFITELQALKTKCNRYHLDWLELLKEL